MGKQYLATGPAGEAGDHHIHRLLESNAVQGVLAADITKPDICPPKVLHQQHESQATILLVCMIASLEQARAWVRC